MICGAFFKKRASCHLYLLIALISSGIHCLAQGSGKTITLYASPDGKAGNSGSASSPMSLRAAVAAVAQTSGPLNATIDLAGGTYTFDSSLILSASSADPARSITFTSYDGKKVVFSGSKVLPNGDFKLLTDGAALAKLPVNARGKVYYINLPAEGIKDFGKMLQHGAHQVNPSMFELYSTASDLQLARWPNSGLTQIGKVIDPGTLSSQGQGVKRGAKFSVNTGRIKNWANAQDVWLSGYFSFGFTDENLEADTVDAASGTIRVKQPAAYGVFASADSSTPVLKNGVSIRGFYVYNLLEELDTAGEWWLDRQTGRLYLWPPDNTLTSATFSVALLEDPLVVLGNIANVTFKGISFNNSRGMGILLQRTSRVTIRNCVFSNLGTVAISTNNQFTLATKKYGFGSTAGAANYNSNLLITGCKIFNTGTGGVTLEGGDRKALTAAGNIVDNCEFYNYSRINLTYTPAVYVDGVGNAVTHCFIHDAPDQAIIFQGNEHKIEYNHFAHVVSYMTDMGAVYTGRDPSAVGTSISYNFFDRVGDGANGSVASIYFDDGTGGAKLTENIFYRADAPGAYGFGAIYVNGGANTVLLNNYFIDCKKALSDAAWTDKQWTAFITRDDVVSRISKDVDIHSAVYKTKYPGLTSLVDSVSSANRKNFSNNTLAYNVQTFSTAKSFTNNNVVSTSTDPGFRNAAGGDFTLTTAPAALQNAQGWKPVPFTQIGMTSRP